MQCAWQCSDKIVRECHVRKNGTCLKLRCAMSIVVLFHYILITSVTIKPVSFSWGFITCNEFDYHWTTWPVIRFKWVVESLSLWYLSLGNYTYSTYIYIHIVSYTIHQKHQNMDTKYIWNDVCKKVGVSWIRAGKDLM